MNVIVDIKRHKFSFCDKHTRLLRTSFNVCSDEKQQPLSDKDYVEGGYFNLQ